MRKLIITIIALASLTACGITQSVPQTEYQERSVLVSFVDYSKYEEGGFYVSPNAYYDKCRNLGELVIIIIPGEGNQKIENETHPGWYSIEWQTEYISRDEMLDMAVKEAKSRGADALVNFNIEELSKKYIISGLCINRE